MGDAVGQMLASAVGIAISPLPLVAVVLMLATPRGRANGLAFTGGWLASLALVAAVVVPAGSGAGSTAGTGGPAAWADWVKLVLGALFLLIAAKQWKGRPREGREPEPPGWMAAIDHFSPAKSAGLAAALVLANPKNLVLSVGGALSIATSDAGSGGKAVAAALLVVIGSLCTLLPLGVYLLGGEGSARVLGEWKAWMTAHNAAIMTTVLIVLAAKYIGDAVSGLTA
jgi:hypothetical protein